MEKAFTLMLAHASKGTRVVWRSESFSQCTPGAGERGEVQAVLKKLRVPILNITQKTCSYVQEFPKEKLGPHLCFPSVALRYWLQAFQEKYLMSAYGDE